MTKLEDVFSYWKGKIEISISWDKARVHCWACGRKPLCTLHKSHIIPKVLGGSAEPSNLVLLCPDCNATNPETIYPDDYWLWLKGRVIIKKNLNISCCYNLDFETEYGLMYGTRLRSVIKILGKYVETCDINDKFFAYIKKNKNMYFARYFSSSVIMFHKFICETNAGNKS